MHLIIIEIIEEMDFKNTYYQIGINVIKNS